MPESSDPDLNPYKVLDVGEPPLLPRQAARTRPRTREIVLSAVAGSTTIVILSCVALYGSISVAIVLLVAALPLLGILGIARLHRP